MRRNDAFNHGLPTEGLSGPGTLRRRSTRFDDSWKRMGQAGFKLFVILHKQVETATQTKLRWSGIERVSAVETPTTWKPNT